MNLVMLRMEETRRIRMKQRSAKVQQQQERLLKNKLEPQQAKERMERNKEWRGRKVVEEEGPEGSTISGGRKCVEWMVRGQLRCCRCARWGLGQYH